MLRIRPIALIGLILPFLHVDPADAALTRYISTTGTASGAGVVNITIETFSKPGWPGPNALMGPTPPTFFTAVPIPASYSAVQTTNAIRDSADAVLGVDYTVTIVSLTYVKIDRPGSGTFSMIVEDLVPGQTIVESGGPPVVGAPALTLPETVGLGLIVLLVCLVSMSRAPRRRSESGS